jgi:hypothetical protein
MKKVLFSLKTRFTQILGQLPSKFATVNDFWMDDEWVFWGFWLKTKF